MNFFKLFTKDNNESYKIDKFDRIYKYIFASLPISGGLDYEQDYNTIKETYVKMVKNIYYCGNRYAMCKDFIDYVLIFHKIDKNMENIEGITDNVYKIFME